MDLERRKHTPKKCFSDKSHRLDWQPFCSLSRKKSRFTLVRDLNYWVHFLPLHLTHVLTSFPKTKMKVKPFAPLFSFSNSFEIHEGKGRVFENWYSNGIIDAAAREMGFPDKIMSLNNNLKTIKTMWRYVYYTCF